MESHRRGDLTEAKVITEMKKREIPVSVPFGDNERYDVVLEARSGDLYRVQIKTGWLRNGAVQFRGYSQHSNGTGNTRKRYGDGIDSFLVYSPDVEEMYWIPQEEVNNQMRLRVDEPEQAHSTINWASEYRFDERWPPDESAVNGSTTVEMVAEFLKARGIGVELPSEDKRSGELLAETPANEFVHLRVRSGSVDDGRLRHPPDGKEDSPDYLAIYHDETENLYLVPGDEYGCSISLRVEEPDQTDSSINWAEDYEFETRWPPAEDR